MTLFNSTKIWRQYILPQHGLSRFAGCVSHCKIPWLKNYLIRWFIKRYQVNMEEPLNSDPSAYASFHEFFIRFLKPGLRPIAEGIDTLCSPADGTISQIGRIQEGTLLQAKNRTFTLASLLGDAEDAKPFLNGHFLTIYLAPKDYHRVHMPCEGILQHLRYIPGKLFSVNPLTTNHVDNLFAVNERVVSFFSHEQGSFAMILVGAMLVGSIATRWGGTLAPSEEKQIKHIMYPQSDEQRIKLDKGDEMGYFSLGSTVILVFPENIQWEAPLQDDCSLVVGQRIGHFLR